MSEPSSRFQKAIDACPLLKLRAFGFRFGCRFFLCLCVRSSDCALFSLATPVDGSKPWEGP